MKIAVLSDIHGNLEALNRVIEDVQSQGVDKIICAGDIVGYGPYPKECISIIREVSNFTCVGNHELGLLDRKAFTAISNNIAVKALEFTVKNIDEADIDYIKTLPRKRVSSELSITMAHGALTKPHVIKYTLGLDEIKECCLAIDTRIGIVGHTHMPLIYNGAVYKNEECVEEVVAKSKSKIFLNPGSVGCSRDGDTRAAYGILSINDSIITACIRRVPYDVEITADAIYDLDLPFSLAARLRAGI